MCYWFVFRDSLLPETRVDHATGEIHASHTMLTINGDAHPSMRRKHKPDPKCGPDDQDKRSVFSIELADIDRWTYGTPDQLPEMVVPPAIELVDGAPVPQKRACGTRSCAGGHFANA
jgi:hypothetical protein